MVDLSIVFCKRLPEAITTIFSYGFSHKTTNPSLWPWRFHPFRPTPGAEESGPRDRNGGPAAVRPRKTTIFLPWDTLW